MIVAKEVQEDETGDADGAIMKNSAYTKESQQSTRTGLVRLVVAGREPARRGGLVIGLDWGGGVGLDVDAVLRSAILALDGAALWHVVHR